MRKKKGDNNYDKYLLYVFIVLAVVCFITFLYTNIFKKTSDNIENISVKYNKGDKYYIITGDYDGEYDYQNVDFSEYFGNYDEASDKIKLFNNTSVFTYDQYIKYCDRWGLKVNYNDSKKNYLVVSFAGYGRMSVLARIANVVEKDGMVSLYLWEKMVGVGQSITGYFIAIPVSGGTSYSKINIAYTDEEYKNIVKYGTTVDPSEVYADKPIIYIYPEKEIEVDVKLSNPSLLTTTYPKYNNGWRVIASPNGNLLDLNTNRNYYGLYYEGRNHNSKVHEDGFIVRGDKVSEFLEEKLEILGLNDREINEFIIYWLPRLESNLYNYIRFETIDEIDSYMPLDINPKPDSVIRVIMDYKGLNEEIKVKEQELIPQKRFGYSVVEWGGSEIK